MPCRLQLEAQSRDPGRERGDDVPHVQEREDPGRVAPRQGHSDEPVGSGVPDRRCGAGRRDAVEEVRVAGERRGGPRDRALAPARRRQSTSSEARESGPVPPARRLAPPRGRARGLRGRATPKRSPGGDGTRAPRPRSREAGRSRAPRRPSRWTGAGFDERHRAKPTTAIPARAPRAPPSVRSGSRSARIPGTRQARPARTTRTSRAPPSHATARPTHAPPLLAPRPSRRPRVAGAEGRGSGPRASRPAPLPPRGRERGAEGRPSAPGSGVPGGADVEEERREHAAGSRGRAGAPAPTRRKPDEEPAATRKARSRTGREEERKRPEREGRRGIRRVPSPLLVTSGRGADTRSARSDAATGCATASPRVVLALGARSSGEARRTARAPPRRARRPPEEGTTVRPSDASAGRPSRRLPFRSGEEGEEDRRGAPRRGERRLAGEKRPGDCDGEARPAGAARRQLVVPRRRATAARPPCRRCCRRGRGRGRRRRPRRGRRRAGPPASSRRAPRARTPRPPRRARGGGRCPARAPSRQPRRNGQVAGVEDAALELREPRLAAAGQRIPEGDRPARPSARRCTPSSARRNPGGRRAPGRPRPRARGRGGPRRAGARRPRPGGRLRGRPSHPVGRRTSRRLYWVPAQDRAPRRDGPSGSPPSAAGNGPAPCPEREARAKRETPGLFARAIHKFPAASYSPTQLTRAVPSAPKGLTAVFGMGTGGAPSIWPPENSVTYQVPESSRHFVSRSSRLKNFMAKPHGRLVLVSFAPRRSLAASTPSLSTWSSPTVLQGVAPGEI